MPQPEEEIPVGQGKLYLNQNTKSYKSLQI